MLVLLTIFTHILIEIIYAIASFLNTNLAFKNRKLNYNKHEEQTFFSMRCEHSYQF